MKFVITNTGLVHPVVGIALTVKLIEELESKKIGADVVPQEELI